MDTKGVHPLIWAAVCILANCHAHIEEAPR